MLWNSTVWRTALSFAPAPLFVAVVMLLCRLGVLQGKDNVECVAAVIVAMFAGPIVGGLIAVWALLRREAFPLIGVCSVIGQWGFVAAVYFRLI